MTFSHILILNTLFTAALTFAIFSGIRMYRIFQSWERINRWIAALIPAAALAFIAQIAYKVYDVVYNNHSWIRFEKTWAVALGFPLYYGAETGPALATIYGPVSVLFYLPATLTRDPMLSIRIAQGLAILIFYLPVAWLHVGKNLRDAKNFSFSLFVFLIFGLTSLMLTSTRQGVFIVHTDAPTLGLAALSCAFIYFRKSPAGRTPLFFSALFAVLAVWTKQVAVPLLPAIALYLLLADGWRAAWRYSLYLLTVGVAISAIFLISFDAQNILFNMFTVPSRHPFREGGPAMMAGHVWRILRDWLLISLWGIFSMGPLMFSKSKPRPISEWFRQNRWSLFLIVGVLMAPLAFISNLKIGGSNNTLSHTTYYMLIASTLAFIAGQKDHAFLQARWIPFTGKGVVLILGVLLTLVYIPSGFYRINSAGRDPNFAREAYEFLKTNPGQAYFPRLTLFHLLLENKLYHTADGLMDRAWAGIPVSKEHFLRHIPDLKNLRYIAFFGEDHRNVLPIDGYGAGYHNIQDLPHFTVYRRNP